MAETLPELISGLAAAASRPAVTDVDLLSAQLGRLRFVHLRRRDVVAQAVSWAKSLQTHGIRVRLSRPAVRILITTKS